MAGLHTSAGPAGAKSSSLFFALFPDPTVAAQLFNDALQLRARHRLTGKVIGAERLHVTVHWLGNHAGALPEALLAQAREAAARVASAPIDLTFDKVRSFFGRSTRPFVMGMREQSPALIALHDRLGAALLEAGVSILTEQAYTPHITLLHDRKPVASQPIAPVRWTARELVLVRSLTGESRYERLESWPFNTGRTTD